MLYSFTGGADGANPQAGLIRDFRGNLYGTTISGGNRVCGAAPDCGVVFKLSPTGEETVIYAFTGGADGGIPLAGLIKDAKGNLYGTTSVGGDLKCSCGTVFVIDTAGKERVLHSFTGGNDGSMPFAGLARDVEGNFYGTTFYGGPSNLGTVFKVDSGGNETVLYSFTGIPDGASPRAGVIAQSTEGGNVKLYGTTSQGGTEGVGTVFELDNGRETILHSFNALNGDGIGPIGLLEAGGFYGTTVAGGALNHRDRSPRSQFQPIGAHRRIRAMAKQCRLLARRSHSDMRNQNVGWNSVRGISSIRRRSHVDEVMRCM